MGGLQSKPPPPSPFTSFLSGVGPTLVSGAVQAILNQMQAARNGAGAGDTGANPTLQEIEERLRRSEEEIERLRSAQSTADRKAAVLQAALERAERQLKDGIQPIILPTREQLEETKRRLQYQEGLYHFAVTGVAGAGKSSLINAFRGLRNGSKSPFVAPTGVVETMRGITRYPDPNEDFFVWYDVPGAGTLEVPDWTYFNDQGLYVFDAIIVLIDTRFTATDIAILRNCARFKIPTYIVRSKSLQHINNLVDDILGDEDDEEWEGEGESRWESARDKYKAQTQKNVTENLEKANLLQQTVYLVDKNTLVQITTRRPIGKQVLDEVQLVRDLLEQARSRRIAVRGTEKTSE
ncbi:hypothetical protein POSPLADRAFT_1135019 [Postia placenta MAD-698-R-SB12]|uniref:IRG-type G domain-containing protein n=1 Tax=Postia placenta MAD-698-R-SB12 TaxID=670580 RepID=A0A1X6NB47_9APHY|nr:hypothetical protein POSPLADRAFT_1135019 [Postia placenta MAD-698-R-SB12]OSX65666.1 hypothetical protein POSPLADRAFT_1135019 [Postia placenta MAD-698-R-SB12]